MKTKWNNLCIFFLCVFTILIGANIASGAVISGKIADPDGMGIANCTIEVLCKYEEPIGFQYPSITKTDGNGNYTLPNIYPCSSNYLTVVPPTTSFYGIYRMFIGDTYENNNLNTPTSLSKKAVSIGSGRVVDAANNVYGGIYINAYSESAYYHDTVVTDKNGYYTFSDLKPANDYVVYIQYETEGSYGYIYYAETEAVICKKQAKLLSVNNSVVQNSDMVIVGIRARTISGIVMDGRGNRITDAEISAWSLANKGSEHGYGYTKSDSGDGTYTINNLLPTKDYIVKASAPGYDTIYYNIKSNEFDADMVDLLCEDVKIDFTLNKKLLIKGIVYIDNISNPAPAGILVSIWSKSGTGASNDALTNDQGEYEIPVIDPTVTDYIISIWQEGYCPAYYYENAANTTVYREEDALVGVGPSDTIKRNIFLTAGSSIKGKVTYNNNLLPHTYVTAWCPDNGVWKSTTTKTGLDGGYNYEISGLLPGTYSVTIYPPDFTDRSKSVTVATSDITDFNFALEEVYKISGTIYNLQSGKKILITAWSEKFSNSTEIIGTGATCTYSITNLQPASDYVVEFTSDYYPNQVYNNKDNLEDADLIDLSSSDKGGIDFTLPGDIVTISGVVNFPRDAWPGEKAMINVFSTTTPWTHNITVTLTSGLSVPYSIPVKADIYKISISSNKYINHYYDGVTQWYNATQVDTTDLVSKEVNFSLSKGATINGTIVDKQGKVLTVPGILVIAQNYDSSYYAYTKANGTFIIEGLPQNFSYSVYILSGDWYSDGIFIPADATEVKNITLTLDKIESITGTVIDNTGKPVPGVWITANSIIQGWGGMDYTDDKGKFTITGLRKSSNYDILASLDLSMPYFPPKPLMNVSTGSNVNFVLYSKLTDEMGHYYSIVKYHVEGVIKGDNIPIPYQFVNIYSPNFNRYLSTYTDKNGKYQFDVIGFSANSYSAASYVISTYFSPGFKYLNYTSDNLIISGNITHNIDLVPGGTIWGKVTNNGIPIKDVGITVYSPSTYSWGYYYPVYTDQGGLYKITGLPKASDYVVTARKIDFFTGTKRDATENENIDFELEASGSITGKVTDAATNQIISGVQIEASLSTSGSGGNAVTNQNGEYTITNLKSGVEYAITASTENYFRRQEVGKIGYKVDFQLTRVEVNTVISGKIIGSDTPALVGADFRLNVFEVQGLNVKFLRNSFLTLDKNGNFIVPGLDPAKTYQLLFMAFSDTNDFEQWADQNGNGIPDDGTIPLEAGIFKTGDSIQFTFIPVTKSFRAVTRSNLAKVQNLDSTTHTPVERDGVSNVSKTQSAGSSNNPNINVVWDASSTTAAGESYYQLFSNVPLNNHKITKRNAPSGNPSKIRSATSPDISGDNVTYYFYVAPIDERGFIGETSYLTFRIDTVGPRNAVVRAIDMVSTTHTATLELGASDASEMYISNVGYGQGGKWEPYATSKQLKVNQGDIVYVQFRDAAMNTTNAMTVVSFISADDLKYAINAMSIVTGITTDSVGIRSINRIGIESAIYHLQKAAGLRDQ